MANAGCGGKSTTPGAEVESEPGRTASNGIEIDTVTYLTGSATRVLAGPLGDPQGLDDFTNGIEPWGPVVATHTVTLPDNSVHVVNQLSSPDPFTAMYQMEDGTLVTTNDPVENIVQGIPSTEPQEIVWIDVDQQQWNVYADEVVVLFEPTTTEQQIRDLISQYDLEVRMSWFEPVESQEDGGGATEGMLGGSNGLATSVSSVSEENMVIVSGDLKSTSDLVGTETSGNAMAWFQFGFSSQVWATLDNALTTLNSNLLVDEAIPSFTDAFSGEYAWPHSNQSVDDYYYKYFYLEDENPPIPLPVTKVLYITAFNIDTNIFIKLPCDYGYNLDTVVGVIDTGVWRGHPDMQGAYTPVGVDCRGNQIFLGMNLGVPDNLVPEGASHGTSVSGMINAVTNNSIGVASIAPRAKVLPFRLDVKGYEGRSPLFGYTSMVKAIRALYFYIPTEPGSNWDFDVPIVNMSIASSGTPFSLDDWSGLHSNITRDVNRRDRLYIASAGNDGVSKKVYPAAYPEVLGVTGLWYVHTSEDHWLSTDVNGMSSNYWSSDDTMYPVSGIYGFVGTSGYYPVAFSVSGIGYYTGDTGATSLASPQIAALAFDILDVFPNLTHSQLYDQVVNSVDESTARDDRAGVPDFWNAFQM